NEEKTSDSIKLEAFSIFADYINTYASTMAANGVEPSTVLALLDQIYNECKDMKVATPENQERLERLKQVCGDAENNYQTVVIRAYNNAGYDMTAYEERS